MFKKLEVAVPEVRFQFYSFQPVAQYEEQFLPESWLDQTQVQYLHHQWWNPPLK